MSGFLGYFSNTKLNSPTCKRTNLLGKSLSEDKLFIQSRTIQKFENDKLFHNDKEYFILTEGIILNKSELFYSYSTTSLAQLFKIMYKKNGETFFNLFRGSFSGLFYDKNRNILLIYTNHIGDKPIFFSVLPNNTIIFGTEYKYIIEILNLNKIKYSLNLAAAYSILTYGYMIGDINYISEIKRLNAGRFLKIFNNKTENIKYHSFQYLPNYKMNDNEIIEEIDFLFSKAIVKQIKKNEEYGYKHLAALSGGLDSRITNFAISRELKSPITSFTYSPLGYSDEIISKKVAKFLGNTHVQIYNDNGKALLYIDESVLGNEGLMTYYGSAILLELSKIINLSNFGLIHTGQIGDGVVGSITKKLKDINIITRTMDAYSIKLTDKFNKYFDFENYVKSFYFSEIFSIYNRAFNGVNSGSLLVFQKFTESYSPFLDTDFFEFCLTIPLEKRLKSNIYYKWVNIKFPEAANYPHNGIRNIKAKFIDMDLMKFRVLKFQKKISASLKKKNTQIISSSPLDYWYFNNGKLKKSLDNYFIKNITLLDNFEELKIDSINLYNKGNAREKNQVLTLISVVKNILKNTYLI